MKRLKIVVLSVAILAAVGGALSNKLALCDYQPQYRLLNGSFVPAGQQGVDYFCIEGSGICTYYRPNPFGPFVPCHNGTYLPLR